MTQSVKVSEAHDLLLAVKHKHIEGFEIDVLKLADGIDRANSDVCAVFLFTLLYFLPLVCHELPKKEYWAAR